MTIAIACPHCHEPLRVPRESQGQRVACPHCKQLARVPQLDTQPEIVAAEEIPQAVPAMPGPGPAIAGMVLGIVGVVFACIAVVSIPLATAAVVFGYIGMQRRRGRGMAIAGFVLGIVGIVLSIAVIVVSLILNSVNESHSQSRQANLPMRSFPDASSSAVHDVKLTRTDFVWVSVSDPSSQTNASMKQFD